MLCKGHGGRWLVLRLPPAAGRSPAGRSTWLRVTGKSPSRTRGGGPPAVSVLGDRHQEHVGVQHLSRRCAVFPCRLLTGRIDESASGALPPTHSLKALHLPSRGVGGCFGVLMGCVVLTGCCMAGLADEG